MQENMKLFARRVPEELYQKFNELLTEWEESRKNKEGWVCTHCGKSTYETDWDYLISPTEHLHCWLIAQEQRYPGDVHGEGGRYVNLFQGEELE